MPKRVRSTTKPSTVRKTRKSSRIMTMERKKKFFHLLTILSIVSSVLCCSYPRIHAVMIALRYLKDSKEPRKPKLKSTLTRKKIDWDNIDCYEDTGLWGDHFEDLLEEITPLLNEGIRRRRKRSLTNRERLYLALHYLKNYPALREYKKLLGISVSTAWKEIKYVMPKLYTCLRKRKTRIHLPKKWKAYNFEGVLIHGAIDCTSHFRCRVHPGQACYYRGDKKGFFITAQVLCSLKGNRIYSVHLGLGHNNDQGMFKRTLQEFIEKKDLRLLSDLGFTHSYLIRPEKTSDEIWRKEQSALRSVVEVVCGLSHLYAVCSTKFRGTPEFQQVCLMCVWELVNWNLRLFPLGMRHSYMYK